MQSNLTHLPRHEYVPGVGMGIAKCPYDPADNSTAVWVEKGNPGELPGLYSGTNAEFTKADTVIFRTDLHNLTTGRREYSFKRTLKYDSKWLDSEYRYGVCLLSSGEKRIESWFIRHCMIDKDSLPVNLQRSIAFHYSMYRQHSALIQGVQKAKFDQICRPNLHKRKFKIATAKCVSWNIAAFLSIYT